MTSQLSTTIRPPIVTVMGHIDHGKTTLLDKIRSSTIWHKESGGITQHIGAYQAVIKDSKARDKLITFIDTPGHAAFVSMRSRGTQVTDLVVLVIAVSEGVMTQTRECLDLIKKNKVEFIVALNKIDLDGSSFDKVKGQLTELGFTPEDYGGQIACIPVSAKTGQGIPELLKHILLHAEVMELKSQPEAPLEAFVIESKVDQRRGPVASVIVKQGTLRVGDQIYSGQGASKVKALIDDAGQNTKEVLPGFPAEILGFSRPPAVGSLITSAPVAVAATLSSAIPASQSPSEPQPIEESQPKLNLIVKADTQGTLEALLASFSDDVRLLSSGVGPVTDNDVFLAQSSQARIYAFSVNTPAFIKKLADNQKVTIFESKIIYEIIKDIEDRVLKLLEPTIDETILAEAQIIAEFIIDKVRIAGVKVTKGQLSLNDPIHLKRDDRIIKDTHIGSLKQGKADVSPVKMGNDCGIQFKPYVDFKINDVIISYNKMGKA